MSPLFSILAGFGAALIAPAVVRLRPASAGYLLAIVPAGLFFLFLGISTGFLQGEEVFSLPWVPSLGIDLSFRADGLALLFAVLITGVGFLVTAYSGAYLKGHPQAGRYYGWLLMFTAAMLGVVFSDNLLLLYVFWELTSITSFMLIGFNHEEEASRSAALQSLLVTNMGGLALLAGAVLLGLAGGTFQISELTGRTGQLLQSPLLVPAILLLLLGAFTKSAQFPFHFWLPNAMVAPTPISAYLHSAAMVKAGIYLLARLSPALSGSEFWSDTTMVIGAITLLLGGYMAFAQTDLKLLLAYSTVAALGLMTLLIGLGSVRALQAAVVFVAAHALYKGALFLVAGAVDRETGTRDVRQLDRLFRSMPGTALAASLAALSMAGVLPLFGAIAKEMAYEAGFEAGIYIGAVVFAGGVSFVFVAILTGLAPFWRPSEVRFSAGSGHEAPIAMWLGPALLAACGLILGLLPQHAAGPLAAPAAAAAGAEPGLNLALWHGFNTPLFLSLAGLLAGTALYFVRVPIRQSFISPRWGPGRLFDESIGWLNRLARTQTHILQSGALRHYLAIIILTMAALVGVPLAGSRIRFLPGVQLEPQFGEYLLAGLIALSAVLAVRSRSILGAVAAMGAAGYAVAAIYMVFGAPDLAMTQFLIESLTVILFVLVFYNFPAFTRISSRRSRIVDAGVALTAGVLITSLVLVAASTQLHHPISDYYIRAAVPEAQGRNIVNVILVDFRALDTLGEISVLAIAAIGVYALIRFKENRKGAGE